MRFTTGDVNFEIAALADSLTLTISTGSLSIVKPIELFVCGVEQPLHGVDALQPRHPSRDGGADRHRQLEILSDISHVEGKFSRRSATF